MGWREEEVNAVAAPNPVCRPEQTHRSIHPEANPGSLYDNVGSPLSTTQLNDGTGAYKQLWRPAVLWNPWASPLSAAQITKRQREGDWFQIIAVSEATGQRECAQPSSCRDVQPSWEGHWDHLMASMDSLVVQNPMQLNQSYLLLLAL